MEPLTLHPVWLDWLILAFLAGILGLCLYGVLVAHRVMDRIFLVNPPTEPPPEMCYPESRGPSRNPHVKRAPTRHDDDLEWKRERDEGR